MYCISYVLVIVLCMVYAKRWTHEPLSSRLQPISLLWQVGAAIRSDRHTALTCADMVSWLSTITPRSRAVSTVVADDDRTLMSRMVTLSTCCHEPSQSVLAGLRRSRLALSHSATSATHCARWSTANWSSATGKETWGIQLAVVSVLVQWVRSTSAKTKGLD